MRNESCRLCVVNAVFVLFARLHRFIQKMARKLRALAELELIVGDVSLYAYCFLCILLRSHARQVETFRLYLESSLIYIWFFIIRRKK